MCDSQKAVNTSTPRAAAIAATSRTSRLLPMPGEPTTATTAPWPVDCTVQQALDGSHLPAPTDQIRLSTPGSAMPVAHAQQPTGGHSSVCTLDLNQLRLAESRRAFDKSRGGLR